MDNISLYSLIALISVIVFIVGIVLLIVSIVMTAKKKKKFVAGIISGIVLLTAGAVFVVYGVFGALTAGLDAAMSMMPLATEFTPDEGSRPISGTLKIDGHEVTIPCSVTDLEHMGYDSDYEYFSGNIDMWPKSNKNGKYEPPHFQVYIDNSYGYKAYDHVRGDDRVSAVKIQNDSGISFEFNDLKFGMSKYAFLMICGTPAHEIDNPTQGDFLYYLGENDTIYRFYFDHEYVLAGIMYGTSDHMVKEMNAIYH